MLLSKLRGILAEKEITQSKLADIIHTSTKTANLKLNGKVPFTVEEATDIVKSLDIPGQIASEIFFG